MVYKISVVWGVIMGIGVIIAMVDYLIVALTMKPAFMSTEQILGVIVLAGGWILFNTIFGLFSKEGVRRA